MSVALSIQQNHTTHTSKPVKRPPLARTREQFLNLLISAKTEQRKLRKHAAKTENFIFASRICRLFWWLHYSTNFDSARISPFTQYSHWRHNIAAILNIPPMSGFFSHIFFMQFNYIEDEADTTSFNFLIKKEGSGKRQHLLSGFGRLIRS